MRLPWESRNNRLPKRPPSKLHDEVARKIAEKVIDPMIADIERYLKDQ